MKIKLFRGLTETVIYVSPPIDLGGFKSLPDHVSHYLNSWVDYHFPGFEINEFIFENGLARESVDVTI